MMPTKTLPTFVRDLLSFPPLHGEGVHNWLFRVARVLHSYRDEKDIYEIIAASVINCGRYVPEMEIWDAIKNSKHCAWKLSNRELPLIAKQRWPKPNKEQIEAASANRVQLVDFWEISPVRLLDDLPVTEEVIDVLFPENPLLCCGKVVQQAMTQRRTQWRGQLSMLQHIVPNPMRALSGHTLQGGESPRCLENTGPRKYIVIEFDDADHDLQAALIWHLQEKYFPLAMIVASGGKSLHAWFSVCDDDAANVGFMRKAAALGADTATFTPCQMVRMPDGLRDNGNRQAIMYFRPEVCK